MNPEETNNEDEIELPKNTGKFVYPDGDYEFVCVEVIKDISGNGNPTLIWSFRGPDELNNGLFKTWTAMTPNAMWKITEYCEALGLGDAGGKVKVSEIKEKAVGRRCIGQLVQETRNGTTRSNIKSVKKHADGPGETREKTPF